MGNILEFKRCSKCKYIGMIRRCSTCYNLSKFEVNKDRIKKIKVCK